MLPLRIRKWCEYPLRDDEQLQETVDYIQDILAMRAIQVNDLKSTNPPVCISDFVYEETVVVTPAAEKYCCPKTTNMEKENTMDYEMTQRDRLSRRIEEIYDNQKIALKTKFHMNLPDLKTQADVLAALKAGNIEFGKYYYDDKGNLGPNYDANGTFTIVDPLKDEAGYEVAKTALQAARTATKDKAVLLPVVDALTALQAFESATF
jgi:hypothetical protein